LLVYETHLETLQAEKHGDARLGKEAAHAGCSLVVPFGHGSGSEAVKGLVEASRCCDVMLASCSNALLGQRGNPAGRAP